MPHFVSTRDETIQNMADVSSDFGKLRVSALRKASQISWSIDKVTLGPQSILDNDCKENVKIEENTLNSPGNDSNNQQEIKKNLENSARKNITFSVKKILLENENQRKEKVRQAVEQRRRLMENSQKALQKEIAMMRWILAMKRESEEAKELERLEAEEERLAQQNEIRRKHEQQLQAQRIKERKEKLEREAEEHRKIREREELVNKFLPLRMHFQEKCCDIGTFSKACKDRNSIAMALAPYANKLKELIAQMETINEKTRNGEITLADLNIAENILQQSEDVSNLCKVEIARIDALFDEEISRREEAVRQAEASQLVEAATIQRQNAEESPTTENSANQNELEAKNIDPNTLPPTPPDEGNTDFSPEITGLGTDSSSIETANEETDGVSADYKALQMYMLTHVFLTNYAATYRDLAQASTLKKFRFECQKAINIPVNAISGINASHIKEKYETLKYLLMGKSALKVTQHPQGVAFCKDVLAKKIVSQGETLISSKPEMAFPVAAVAVALWNDYPDFGELLLAHFRRTCPYVLPVFMPRLQGQTNEEYYRSLGYKYSEDGVVEKQDKYLTRMSGLMRLYASIIVTAQRREITEPHPHGIRNAWRWLAVTLNAEVRPDILDVCATLILDMLEVAGNALWQAYPRQFPKMLVLLAKQYFPRMVNEAGIAGGPMTRLEQFIKDCLADKTIPPPEGLLPANFW